MVECIHFNCVICHSKNANSGEEATVVLISILMDNSSIEGIYKNLCFLHRRKIDDLVSKIQKERIA